MPRTGQQGARDTSGPEQALRPMREADLPGVVALEQAAYPHPWTEGIFLDCLRAGYCCWVAAAPARTLGYGVLSVAADECHLLNLCVHPEEQGRGLGHSLLGHLLAVGRSRAAERVFLEVRMSNVRAIGLYRSAGFTSIGVRRGYYPKGAGREDALVMTKALV